MRAAQWGQVGPPDQETALVIDACIRLRRCRGLLIRPVGTSEGVQRWSRSVVDLYDET
jgi:hypothetical protein